jgi:thymidylate kinase
MPVPDITFLLKLPVEETLRRKAAIKSRPYEEVFERDRGFIRKVQEQYDLLVNLHSNENIVVIDGNRTKEAVFEDIKAHVDKLLFNK